MAAIVPLLPLGSLVSMPADSRFHFLRHGGKSVYDRWDIVLFFLSFKWAFKIQQNVKIQEVKYKYSIYIQVLCFIMRIKYTVGKSDMSSGWLLWLHGFEH